MAELSTCPSRDELQQMVLGQLKDEAAARIQKHLEWCPKCWCALDQCVASDAFLDAVQANRGAACEPTKTMYLPVEWIRSALSTWIRSHDSTQADKHLLSMADVQSLLSPPQSADEIGRIADFRVLRVLGVGGMAVVFEAEDSHLMRHVALKLMRPSIAAKPGGAERFLREAQSAAALKHEHVVAIHQIGMHGQRPFIALELLHGQTLENYLVRNGRLSVHDVIRIGREIAMGLAAAHARGLVHRDIKPANIWLEGPEVPAREPVSSDDKRGAHPATAPVESGHPANCRCPAGKVKILDFGCAKVWTDDADITDPGLLIGTPAYMAPEQLTGNAVDPRADLFSLGCLLYRMAGGKPPFGGDNVLSVVRALALEEPTALGAVNPEVPRSLSELIGDLLSKSPDDRPATAQGVVDQLWAIEEGLPRKQVAEGVDASDLSSESGARRKPRKKWPIGVGVGLALVLPFVYLFYGAQIIRIATNQGQVVIEVDDPTLEVTVKENRIVIFERQSRSEINLTAGEHQFEVTVEQPLGELTFNTDKFTLQRGGRKVVEVQEELAKAVAASTAARPMPPQVGSGAAIVTSQGQASPNMDRRAALWVLSLGGSVNVRVGHAANPTEILPAHELPASDFALTNIHLEKCTLSDAGLEHLRDLKNLEELNLSATAVTGAGFEHLQGLTKLRTLIVKNTNVVDAGLRHIAALPKLERLWLDRTKVTDEGLVQLKALQNLHVLVLNGTRVTDAGLVQLSGMPQLDTLSLRKTRVTDAGLVHVRDLMRLRILNLSRLPVTDAGLANIQTLINLQILVLDGTRVTDAGLAHLKDLTQLNSLDLGKTRVTNAGLAQLKGLTRLGHLNLGATRVTAAGLVELQGLKNLHVLSLNGATSAQEH